MPGATLADAVKLRVAPDGGMEIETGDVSVIPLGSAPSVTVGIAVVLISAAERRTEKLVFAYTFAGTGDEQNATTAGPLAGRV